MLSYNTKLFVILVLTSLSHVSNAEFIQASAQSSSEETTITRGVGFRQSNKFEFKYKERIKTYEEQIQMGLKRGWLSEEDAKTFSLRLDKLKNMEASVSTNGYPKPELDNLELEITKFNKEFSDAGQKTNTPSAPKPQQAISKPQETLTNPSTMTSNTKPVETKAKKEANKETKKASSKKPSKKK